MLSTTILVLVVTTLGASVGQETSSEAPPLSPVGASRFEAFYAGRAFGQPSEDGGTARAPHAHGSFYGQRNVALIDAPNAAAYGFRFDSQRRFNYD